MLCVSQEGRLWAVKELARRAGVTQEFFRSLSVEVTRETTIVHVQPGSSKQLRFRNLPADGAEQLASSSFRTLRAAWMRQPGESVRKEIPDLVVPYCKIEAREQQTLFRQTDADTVECFADLPASTLFCLCRVEETQESERDAHSRFTAAMSVARRDDFLYRPVVDEWGLALAQALEALLPGWSQKQRPLRAKISHDVDEVGRCNLIWPQHLNGDARHLGRFAWMLLPFDVRHAIRLGIGHQNPMPGIAHLCSVMAPSEPGCIQLLESVIRAELRHGLEPAVYWKATAVGPFDSGYDPRDKRVRTVIRQLEEQGIENGFHAGYRAFDSLPEMQSELETLREVIGDREIGGRMHYLRWVPETWLDWERCGLAYDSSVGYANDVGFRAGTCLPYRPWLLSRNREARLLEVPLIAMDVSLVERMQVRGEAQLRLVRELINKCAAVGGVFTFLCHATAMRDKRFVREYEQILDLLASAEKFDWKAWLANEWLN